jgi:5-methylcytosine-specific restriction protein A
MPSRPEIARLRNTRRYKQARRNVLARDHYMCWICGRPGADTADHVVPLAQGGDPTSEMNLRAAHRSCNSRRQDNQPTSSDVHTSRRW